MPSTYSYTLSLHDALPILLRSIFGSGKSARLISSSWSAAQHHPSARHEKNLPATLDLLLEKSSVAGRFFSCRTLGWCCAALQDRKSTRLNSSHLGLSYAVYLQLHSVPTRRSSDLAAFDLRIGEISKAYFVELERGTTPPERAARKKSPGYTGLATRKIQCSREIFFVPHARVVLCRAPRSEEHTSELQSLRPLVCRLPTATLCPYTTLFRSCCVRSSDRGNQQGLFRRAGARHNTTRARGTKKISRLHWTCYSKNPV